MAVQEGVDSEKDQDQLSAAANELPTISGGLQKTV